MALAINIVLGANTVNFSRNIQKATKQAEKELKGLSGFAQKAFDKINAGTLIGAGTLTTIAAAADKMQSLASKVKLATDSAEQFTAVQNQLRNIANEQRSSFEGVVDLYSSSQRALSQLGKSQQDAIGFTRNMTMAMNLGGGSAQAQAAALTQLGQALGSGALRGDEFNSVAEQAPILMELIAKKMGVATSALRDLAKDGKITADVVYGAVAGSTAALEEMTSKTAFTMASGFQVVKDNFGYLVHDIVNETTGIAGAISDVLAFVGQNLKTIATIAGVTAAVIGAKMLLGSAKVKEFAANVLTKTTAMRADAAETIRNAYSIETYNQANLRLIHTKNLLSQRLAVARLAKLHYSMSIKEAWATTTGYIQSQLTLTNAKNITTAAITRATGAVVGFGRATATNIVAAASYTQSLFTINGAKTAFIGATRAAISGVVGFGSAVKAGTVSVAQYTHALMTSTVAKRAFVGTASLAGTAVGKIGTAFAAVGRIIMAHPIMIIGGIITAVIVRTMGLQKAMESLSDAFAIAADMLGQLIDWGVDGFKSLWNGASGFLDGFGIGSKDTCGAATSYFASFFETNHTGFVGVLHVAAKVFDGLIAVVAGTIKTVWQNFKALFNGIRNGFVRAVNAVTGAIAGIANAIGGVINKAIDDINGLIDGAAKIAAKAGIDIGGRIGRRASTNWQGTQIAVTQDDTNLTLAENIKNSNYGIAVGAFNRSTTALEKSKKAQDAANDSMNKGAAAADKAAKAAGGKGKADKDAANAANKLSDASKKAAAATNEVNDAITKLQKDIALFGKDDPMSALQYDIDKGKYTGVAQEKLQELKTLTEQFYTLQKNESVKDKILAIDEKIYALGKNEVEILAYQLDHAKEYKGVSEKIKQSYLERTKALLEAEKAHERIKKIEESEKSLNKAKYELKHFGDAHAGTRWELKDQGYNDEEIGKIIGHEKAKEDIGKLGTLFDQLKNNQVFGNVGVTAQIDGVGGGFDFAGQMLGQSFDIAQKFKEQNALLKAAQEQGLIDEADYLKRSEQLTAAHVEAKGQLMQTATQSVLGGITGIMKNVYGEQSKHYKIAFAMEKAYSVATIIMKQKEALAKAWASAPFPANLGAVASTLASTGALAAAVNAIRPVGQAHDGIMSVPKSGTWNLEKGERVLPKHTAQNLDNTLNRLQGRGETKVIINNYTGEKTDVQQMPNGDTMVIIGKMIDAKVDAKVNQRFIQARRQGGELYGR